jgi:hypothetical protein
MRSKPMYFYLSFFSNNIINALIIILFAMFLCINYSVGGYITKFNFRGSDIQSLKDSNL